jgi:diacylglycerol kinase (ATP)
MKNSSRKISVRSRAMSFYYAFRGIGFAFRQEHNLWIDASAAGAAIALGFILHVSTTEWLVIVLAITGVFAAELFNSSVEALVDLCSPGIDERAGRIKDMAAGAVLITALGALATGLIIFIPKLTDLF